jgi:plasmid maintenance system killer protein
MGVQSFGDAPTERLWSRQRTKRLDPQIERTALRKLVMLDAAGVLDGLKVPPGNRLDALKADRAGQTAFGPTSSGGSASSGPGRHRERRDHRLPLEGGTHMATLAPIHPGEVLLEEFLVPLEVTQHRLAVSIGVPRRRINEIVYGKRRITAQHRAAVGPASSRPPTGSGSTFRPATTSRSKRTALEAHSITSSRSRAPDLRASRHIRAVLNAQRRGVLSNSMVQVGPAAWASRRSPVRSVASSASARATYAAS